jgi:hypothetical protein
MDDGSLFGKVEDVLNGWSIIKEEGPRLGLLVNKSKCELIASSGSTEHFQSFDSDLIRITDGNMSILGSAIGCKHHCADWIFEKLNKKLPPLLLKLETLGHLQSSFLLLLFCSSFCKMVWYIRTIPSIFISDSCNHFDALILRCFENLIGAGLPIHSLSQARLGTKRGGCWLACFKNPFSRSLHFLFSQI